MRIVVIGALLAGCATTPKRAGLELPAPQVVALAPFMQTDLRTVKVDAGGRTLRFLFDTGGGITVISPQVAELVGCKPAGRLTAHRMSGQRIDAPRCDAVPLTLGAVALKPDAIVMDLARLMPPEWERVDGLVSLQTIEALPFTLSLAENRLVLETPSSLEAQVSAGMQAVSFRVARPAGGAAVDVFMRVEAEPPLWMILDSGNIDQVVLAPHAAKQLGAGTFEGLPARELDILYDGNLGAAYLKTRVVSVELVGGRMWLRAAPR